MYLPHYTENDKLLDSMLPQLQLTEGVDFSALEFSDKVTAYEIEPPDETYRFLHEAAIIKFKGVLYASWYNCPRRELVGDTPIRGKRSYDNGKTWSDIEVIVADPEGRILACPPVYGIDGDKLYMLINLMSGPDRMHGLCLYVLNEATGKFEHRWSRHLPFKLNTNVVRLSNGKLMLPGRLAKAPEGFPTMPAVLISDSGHIDDIWRLVPIKTDGELPDCSNFIHPEISAMVEGEKVIMFCRDDERSVPIVFISNDNGEHWSLPTACDIPFSNSKMYAGTLESGRHYVIGNIYPGRTRLMLLLTEPGETKFTKGYLLAERSIPDIGFDEDLPPQKLWHYPAACEADGKLYVICTVTYDPALNTRGAALFVVDDEK